MSDHTGPAVPMTHYSAALDEIYFLRSLLAHEARVIDTQLGYRSLPKRVRASLSSARERLMEGARGERHAHIQGTSAAKFCLRWAGASETLTRTAWEVQRGLRIAEDERVDFQHSTVAERGPSGPERA